MGELKYSQELNDIKQMLLTGVKPSLHHKDIQDFNSEYLAFEYLTSIEFGLATSCNLIKPSVITLLKAFNRYLAYLDTTFGCSPSTVDTYPSPTIVLHFKTCHYYFHLLSNSDFLDDKPSEILTLVGALDKNKC